jgi:hypothetical protein
VALELCNGAINNDGHQCSDDKCRTKREPAQHPLSIAAILDLHCAHIEFCKKLRGAGMRVEVAAGKKTCLSTILRCTSVVS